jgi:hypothetical protein
MLKLDELLLIRNTLSRLSRGSPLTARGAIWLGTPGALLIGSSTCKVLLLTGGPADYCCLFIGFFLVAYSAYRYWADRPLALDLERAKTIVRREREQLGLKD